MQKVNATVSEMLQRNGTLADASSHRFPHYIASSLPRASQKPTDYPFTHLFMRSCSLGIKTASKHCLMHFI